MEWPQPSPKLVGILQKYILSKAAVQIVSPGDCKQISKHIEGLTGKVISETTLKRFFGFAQQQYNFSRFTLNTLAEFVGFSGWEDFCSAVPLEGDGALDQAMWEESRRKALQVTATTLSSLKNLSGVPFQATISRSAIEADFAYFLNSDYQFFCLTGTSGIGKSIQMAHLTDNFFLREDAPYRDAIVWLLKGPTLKKLEPEEFNFEEYTREQFEVGQKITFLKYFREHPQEVRGKLMLMLDGFDDHVLDAAEQEKIFQKIIDLLCYGQGCEWLKVVVSLRTSTWLQLQKRINESEYLKKTWFSGVFYQKEARSNLMPLNKQEVKRALKIIQEDTRSENGIAGNAELYTLLGNPFFLHLYYQLLKKNPNASLRGSALYCELVASYVFQKIYQSGYSVEKLRIIEKLIKATNYGKSSAPVERRILFEANDMYVLGYNDLLSEGILEERNVDSLFNYRIYVQFQHPAIFTYFVAQHLIDNGKEFSSVTLFKKVMQEYPDEQMRNLIIQWLMLFAVVNKPDDMTTIMFHPRLAPIETARLIVFITDLIEENPNLMTEDRKSDFIRKSVYFLAAHFLELDHIGTEQQGMIRTLLSATTDPVQEANLLILQGTIAIALMDKKELEQTIDRLRKLDRNTLISAYPLHPVRAMEFIYRFYSLEPLTEFFNEDIHNFIEYPPDVNPDKQLSATSLLSYQLGIFATMFGRSPRQSIAFVDVVKRLHPDLFSGDKYSGVAMYLLMRQAFAYLRRQMKPQAQKILEQLQRCGQLFAIEENYSHSMGLYEILQGEIAMGDGNLKQACGHFLMAYKFSKYSGFTMLQLYSALPLIRVYNGLKDYEGATRILEDLRLLVSHIDFPLEKLLLNRIMEQV